MANARRLSWTRNEARIEEDRNDFKILTNKPKGKSIVEMPRLKWQNNIRMKLKEIVFNVKK